MNSLSNQVLPRAQAQAQAPASALAHTAEVRARSPMRRELERIRAAYARRREQVPPERYSRMHPANLCSLQQREQAMVQLLAAAGIHSLRGWRILEVGCGRGDVLRHLLDYDAEPPGLCGVDLLDYRIAEARRRAPHLQFSCANAAELPFPDSLFDLVLQFTVFSSVLSPQVKQAMAREVERVTASGGKLLWYDFAMNNPRNPDVRGVRRKEISSLFPGWPARLRRITLAPPLARRLAPISPALCRRLAGWKFLCTHYLVLLEKPK